MAAFPTGRLFVVVSEGFNHGLLKEAHGMIWLSKHHFRQHNANALHWSEISMDTPWVYFIFALFFPVHGGCRLPSSTRWVPLMLPSESWKQWSWTAWVSVTLSTRGSPLGLTRDEGRLTPWGHMLYNIILLCLTGLPFQCPWWLHFFGRCWWREQVFGGVLTKMMIGRHFVVAFPPGKAIIDPVHRLWFIASAIASCTF